MCAWLEFETCVRKSSLFNARSILFPFELDCVEVNRKFSFASSTILVEKNIRLNAQTLVRCWFRSLFPGLLYVVICQLIILANERWSRTSGRSIFLNYYQFYKGGIFTVDSFTLDFEGRWYRNRWFSSSFIKVKFVRVDNLRLVNFR